MVFISPYATLPLSLFPNFCACRARCRSPFLQAKTQLIAHDKEVYDLAFAAGVNVFASVGADGSVRTIIQTI